jgi:uncharacterized cupin superfamily protein
VRRFNLFAPEFDHSSERDGYQWRGASVGDAVGADEIGASLYRLEDGQKTYPYHFHHVNEEWLLVLAGSPTVRTPSGERVLRKGDVLCFPVGPDGAHQVTGPGTVLIVSERPPLDSVEFPDSGKVSVSHPRKVFMATDSVDFWDGE